MKLYKIQQENQKSWVKRINEDRMKVVYYEPIGDKISWRFLTTSTTFEF